MLVYKAYLFRLYPSREQELKLKQFLGSSRFIYNYYLAQKKKMYEESKTTYCVDDMKKNLKELEVAYPFLKEVDSCILRTAIDNLDYAYKKFFTNKGGYPSFKKRGYQDRYRTTCIRGSYKGKSYQNIKVDLERHVIKLPKLGEIKIRGYRHKRNFDGKILNATVKKEGKKYYVAVCVEEEIKLKEFRAKSSIGLDLGIKNIITTSEGIKYDRLSCTKRIEKKLKGLQRALARSQRGSNNRQKLIEKIRRCYQKIRNMRKYYIHEITSKIVMENDIILTENLKVKEMMEAKEHHLGKELSNACFHEIIRQLEYKSRWQNKKLYQVDTYYPSSQLCNRCGEREKAVKNLGIRKWECSKCGNRMDRDINASLNIRDKGLEQYYKEVFQS